jgi:hypothetical protein
MLPSWINLPFWDFWKNYFLDIFLFLCCFKFQKFNWFAIKLSELWLICVGWSWIYLSFGCLLYIFLVMVQIQTTKLDHEINSKSYSRAMKLFLQATDLRIIINKTFFFVVMDSLIYKTKFLFYCFFFFLNKAFLQE